MTLYLFSNFMNSGGGGGIRTHGTLACSLVFKAGAFDHSATSQFFYSFNNKAKQLNYYLDSKKGICFCKK